MLIVVFFLHFIRLHHLLPTPPPLLPFPARVRRDRSPRGGIPGGGRQEEVMENNGSVVEEDRNVPPLVEDDAEAPRLEEEVGPWPGKVEVPRYKSGHRRRWQRRLAGAGQRRGPATNVPCCQMDGLGMFVCSWRTARRPEVVLPSCLSVRLLIVAATDWRGE